ncbi:MAG: hypothetical protein DRH26_15120 [Deltaproteobacteria bacterium]|nr:MAG: hypothetical protein DRH26_15120 [Deltaproteobacteria bacterium]
MKITDPQVIEDGEKDLINAVQEDLDMNAVKQIFKDRMGGSTLDSKGGQIVVHNNKIAFRLDFDINLSGSLLFDREGNYIDDSGGEEHLEPAGDPEIALEEFDAGDAFTDEGIETSLSDGIPLVETGLDETDPTETAEPDLSDTAEPDLPEQNLSEQNLEDTISIGLPEYDLEEEADMPPLDFETGELLPDESDLETEDLEPMIESKEFDTQNLENESLEDNDLADEAVLEDDMLEENMLEDDINGILKESREFWEQKKDS